MGIKLATTIDTSLLISKGRRIAVLTVVFFTTVTVTITTTLFVAITLVITIATTIENSPIKALIKGLWG